MSDVTVILTATSVAAAIMSVSSVARVLVTTYAVVVVLATAEAFFQATLPSPVAWMLLGSFASSDALLCLHKLWLLVRPPSAPRGKSETLPFRALLRIPVSTAVSEARRLSKEIRRVAPMFVGIYSSLLMWCVLMAVWVGTLTWDAGVGDATDVDDVAVAALALTACCATFEVSVQMQRGANANANENENESEPANAVQARSLGNGWRWIGAVVVQSLLIHPSVALAIAVSTTAAAVIVMPPGVSAAYAVSVGVFPWLLVTALGLARRERSNGSSFMWDARVAAESAWWATFVVLQTTAPSSRVWLARDEPRTDHVAMALSVLALLSAVWAVGMMLLRTVPTLLRDANDADDAVVSGS